MHRGNTPVAEQTTAEPPRREAEIRAELARVLESAAFRGSHRSQEFLRYAVEKTLASRQAELKERNIAIDVFGRPADVNLTEDTIVRVSAREVRRRLEQYYSSPETGSHPLRIHLPPGAYVPEFQWNGDLDRCGTTTTELEPLRRAAVRKVLARHGLVLLAVVVLGATGFLSWKRVFLSPDQRVFDGFWGPVLSAPREVLIGVPHPIVYHPSTRANQESNRRLPPQDLPLQRPLALRPDELTGADFVLVQDQYVAFGDLLAASSIQALMAVRGKPVKVRLASKLDLADLKETPCVLVGAYTNRWSLELGQGLRFRFVYTQDGRAAIADSTSPTRQWALPALTSDGTSDVDYLLIDRLIQSWTGQPVIRLAGLKQFGTGAGGELLTEPVQLAAVLKAVPSDRWMRSNLQMVLQMRVIGNTPAPPRLVAWHIW